MHRCGIKRISVPQIGMRLLFCIATAMNPQASHHTPAAPSPSTAHPADGLAGFTVLMVDDNHDTLEAFGELLRMEGAQVQGASSGARALAWLAQHDCDLILSDLAMPDMSGLELITHIRTDAHCAQHARTPAIALSGYGSDTPHQVAGAGFTALLRKPVRLSELLDAVAALGITPQGSRSARTFNAGSG